MKIEKLVLGPLETNCYIVSINNDAIVIDPADEIEKICLALKDYNLKGILVTHHHFDHVGALKDLEDRFNLKHNSEYIEGFNYNVIKNPGHTMDSISFYFEENKILFAGDFIFNGSIGRYDFLESSAVDMQKSLEMISSYPDDITIYPGHGPHTILGNEKRLFKYYF